MRFAAREGDGNSLAEAAFNPSLEIPVDYGAVLQQPALVLSILLLRFRIRNEPDYPVLLLLLSILLLRFITFLVAALPPA